MTVPEGGPRTAPLPAETVVLRTLTEFAAIGAEWDRLADRFQRALLRHDWFVSCAETLHAESDLRVVTVRRQHRLVAAAPLALGRDGWWPCLQFLGMSALYEPAGVLYADDDALAALADGLRALAQPLVLQRLEADGPVPPAIRRAFARRGATMTRPTSPSAVVAVRGSWAEYERSLPSQIRTNVKRHRARAGKAVGTVTTEVASPGVEEVDALLATVVAVEGSGWKGRNGSALRCRPDLLAFFRAYARRAAEAGRLRVALLRFGDRVAAVELAVEDYGRWWQLKIGFDDDLAGYYPGLQLTLDTVRRAFDQRLDAFEFLGAIAGWEERWNPERRAYEACVAYPATLRGGVALAGDITRAAVRRVRARLRAPAGPR